MPKEVFFRLKKEKQDLIIQALIDEFEQKTLHEATVKSIIERLNISRGSFYQYFFDLEEAYFFILDKKFNFVHISFLKLYDKYNKDLKKTLLEYKDFLVTEIYKPENYNFFKNRYLSWSFQLEYDFKKYKEKNNSCIEFEKMYNNKQFAIIKVLMHMIIKNIFLYKWPKETFIKEYEQLVKFIMEGINYV